VCTRIYLLILLRIYIFNEHANGDDVLVSAKGLNKTREGHGYLVSQKILSQPVGKLTELKQKMAANMAA